MINWEDAGRRIRLELERLDRFVLPPLCAFCRVPTQPDETGVCNPCRDDLPRNVPACPRCAVPMAADPGQVPCAECQARPPPVARVLASLRYEFPVDAAIRALKFRRRLEFLPVLSSSMLACLEAHALNPDLIVPVPLHFLRHGRRGFNQAERLARPVAKALGVPLVTNAVRVRATQTQSGLDARDRRRNLKATFRVDDLPEARHALIVDDVMTTGATASEFARTLSATGKVEEISVLVAARRGLVS